MDITGLLSPAASEWKLKEIFAPMPIMVLNNINTCSKMDLNALFGTTCALSGQ